MSLNDKVSFSIFDGMNKDNQSIKIDPDRDSDIQASMEGKSVPKRRGRPRKKDKEETKIAEEVDSGKNDGVKINDNIPFTIVSSPSTPVINQYADTTMQLRNTVCQIDQLAAEVKEQLDLVKSSRTLRGKYKNVSDLAMVAGNLLSTKVAAIREINKTLTDVNNLELKRAKDNMDADANKSNEQRIMELYAAYTHMPVGNYQGPQFPSMVQSTVGNAGMIQMGNAGPQTIDVSPEMNRLLLENNPNIKTVVMYDPETNYRQFDVIDTTTGQSVPNYPRPSNMELEGLSIEPNHGLAVNRNLGTQYPLMNRPTNSIPMNNGSDDVMKKF